MKFSDLFFEEDEKQFDSRYDFIDKIVKPKNFKNPWIFNHFKKCIETIVKEGKIKKAELTRSGTLFAGAAKFCYEQLLEKDVFNEVKEGKLVYVYLSPKYAEIFGTKTTDNLDLEELGRALHKVWSRCREWDSKPTDKITVFVSDKPFAGKKGYVIIKRDKPDKAIAKIEDVEEYKNLLQEVCKKRELEVDFFGFLSDIKKYNKEENLDLRKIIFWPHSTDFKKDLDY